MENPSLAFALYKLTERNRDLTADYLNKSALPNHKDMCAGQLDFASVIGDLEKPPLLNKQEKPAIASIMKANTETVHVTKSPRELSVEMSQAYLVNLAMVKLLNHSLKQDRAAVDNFRPS